MNRLFVYGTLKRGLRVPGSTNLGPATAEGTLYNVSWFPGVRFDKPGENPVQGVVFEIADEHAEHAWKALDSYEGVPTLYTRIVVPVTLESGDKLDAYTYQICEGNYYEERMIPSGLWESA